MTRAFYDKSRRVLERFTVHICPLKLDLTEKIAAIARPIGFIDILQVIFIGTNHIGWLIRVNTEWLLRIVDAF